MKFSINSEKLEVEFVIKLGSLRGKLENGKLNGK